MPDNLTPDDAPLGGVTAANGPITSNAAAPPVEHVTRTEMRALTDRLDSRLDSMATMMNQLMELCAAQGNAPNITGWPRTSGPHAPPPPQPQRALAEVQRALAEVQQPQAGVNMPPPMLQTIGIQSPNHYSTQVQLQPAAPTPLQVAPTARQPHVELSLIHI